jgi:hypothetical protein
LCACETLALFELIQAISSFRFFAGTPFLDTISSGLLASSAIGSKSFSTLYWTG